jgi:uncharacterized protein DUF6084
MLPTTVAVPQLDFAVLDAAPLQHAAVPTLRFTLRVRSAGGMRIRSVLLDTQVQIAARRRGYDDEAVERLFDLFGAKDGWGSTLRTLLWTRLTRVVPDFTGSTVVDLDVPCSYDLDVVATRYFDALADGEVPLEFLFSGSVFYAGANGMLQTTRLSWEQEAGFRLPVAVWKETLDRHFKGTAWLRLPKDSFDRLVAFKARGAYLTWEEAVDALLADPREPTWTP